MLEPLLNRHIIERLSFRSVLPAAKCPLYRSVLYLDCPLSEVHLDCIFSITLAYAGSSPQRGSVAGRHATLMVLMNLDLTTCASQLARPLELELSMSSSKKIRLSSTSATTSSAGGTPAVTTKHAVGYNSEWEKDFPWLHPVHSVETGSVTGMLCRLCKKHKTKNKYNQTVMWSETPCVSLRRDCLRRHSLSQQHKSATELEVYREDSERTGGIEQAFQSQIALNRSAVKVAMECLYWLVKSEIPHTTHYYSLVKAVEFMGCNQLYHGENAKYSSQRVIQEFQQVMGEQIEQEQLENLLSSPFYSIMVDETTDVAILKEMVVYIRYLSPAAKVCTSFLTIIELPNGTAETVEKYLTTYLESKLILLSNMVGFGSDGASVMIGRHNGVAARLKCHQPILTSIHCIAHRLALAAGQSGDSVPYIANTIKPTLRQLFYFYENSPVRMSGLKAIEQLLQTPQLKLNQPADTRWLSHDAACQMLMRVLPAVIASLEREAAERGQALAIGLCKVVKQYNFISTLYMMCDVLPLLSRLSRVFQSSILDLATVDNPTIENLQLLSDQTGYLARKLDSDLSSSLAPFDIRHSPEMKHRFQQHILQKFLHSVVQNIKDRFPDTSIYANFKVLTPINLPQTAEEAVEIRYGEKEVQKLGQQYGIGDQPFIHSEELMLEWSDLRTYMILNCASKTMIEMLEMLSDHGSALSTVYPNFNKLAQVCLLLPLNTAGCERAFSTMRRVKSRLRSQMNNSTLNNCMRISMEGPPFETFNFDTALDSWSKLRNRRII